MSEKRFGLIGKRLGHSKSKELFEFFFKNADYTYDLIEIEPDKLSKDFLLQFDGLNVTIPYKKEVIKYLDELDDIAEGSQSVNCIERKNGKLIGHNTDYYGINFTLTCGDTHMYEMLRPSETPKALILGNGGASAAIQYYLKNNNISFDIAGRDTNKCDILFSDIKDLSQYVYIINATPVGMFPNVDDIIELPYNTIAEDTLVFDLIYNPLETKFFKECAKYSKHVVNGSLMLNEQAMVSYKFWNIL